MSAPRGTVAVDAVPAPTGAPTLPASARPLVEAPRGGLRRLVDRFADRLNPILVREVRQALNSKGFVITAALALLATVLIALGVAWEGEMASGKGRDVFVLTTQALLAILLFIVPIQAFLSMRHEVTAGTVEHLLMSRLTPGQIVRGKLGAAVVQFVLYLSIFAPLATMSFLLRGIDVPTIAVLVLMAFLFGVSACALGVACGALSRWPNVFRVLPLAVMVLGLGSTTAALMGGVEELAREIPGILASDEFSWVAATILITLAAGTYLFGLVGAAMLAHPYENRSSAFRLFAWLGTAAGLAWTAWVATRPSMSRGFDAETLWAMSGLAAIGLALFPLFASSEDPRLSPRVRRRVPKNPLLALVVAPFLPGAGRGLLFTLLLAGTAMGGAAFAVGRLNLTPPDEDVVQFATWAWLYVLFYCGVASFVRGRLGPGSRATWIARAAPIVLLLLGIVGPVLFEAFARPGLSRGWQAYELLNPFRTIDSWASPSLRQFQLNALLLLAGLSVLVLGGLGMVRGVLEVLAASRERRRGA